MTSCSSAHLRLLLAALAWCGPASAGSVDGPYIVWVNLGTHDPGRADAKIRGFMNGDDRLCLQDGSLLFMTRRPAQITPARVRQALLKGDLIARRRLQAALRQAFDDVPGFDGLVAYTDAGPPRLWSLSTSGRVRSEALRGASGEEAWGATFCNVLPPIERKP